MLSTNENNERYELQITEITWVTRQRCDQPEYILGVVLEVQENDYKLQTIFNTKTCTHVMAIDVKSKSSTLNHSRLLDL